MTAIVDLEPRHEPFFATCLEDRLPEAGEAGDHRARWVRRMKERGLGVKPAVNDKDVAVGMIQYVPASATLLDGSSAGCRFSVLGRTSAAGARRRPPSCATRAAARASPCHEGARGRGCGSGSSKALFSAYGQKSYHIDQRAVSCGLSVLS